LIKSLSFGFILSLGTGKALNIVRRLSLFGIYPDAIPFLSLLPAARKGLL
jgi:hypothetical protein